VNGFRDPALEYWFFLFVKKRSGPEWMGQPMDTPDPHANKLDDRQRRQLQHELKLYMEKYFKE